MACGGPSIKFAHERAEAAEKEIMELLRTKYDIRPPRGPLMKTWEGDWNKGKRKLKDGLKDIFWADACDSF